MKPNAFAAKLNGIELNDIGREVTQEAARANIVIVYGSSRDTITFAGAIEGEADVPEGGTIHFDTAGLLPEADDVSIEEQADYYDRKRMAYLIDAEWQQGGFTWSFTTIIPHHRFVVMNEGARYCRGIVFDIQSLGGAV